VQFWRRGRPRSASTAGASSGPQGRGTSPQGRLKRAWSDGTTALELSAEELAERRAALVPPPRANPVRYGGVLAARHRTVRPRPPTRPAASPRGQAATNEGGHRELPLDTVEPAVVGGLRRQRRGVPDVRKRDGAARWFGPRSGRPATLSVLASLERSARGPPASEMDVA
jgi:hypothetical protein